MTHGFKLLRRIARLRAFGAAALVFVLPACNEPDALSPESSVPVIDVEDPVAQGDDGLTLTEVPSAAVSYAGGIPFGNFGMPTSEYGTIWNGAQRNIHAQYLLRELSAIKNRGGKVMLKLSNGDKYFKDAAGNFSLTKWKARVDLYKNVNFSSYINDGTIIGHYLVDEPQDPANWNGKPISQATIEEMAKHSKDRWPGMATIVRTWPDYLDNWSGSYRYLDAAWAQYSAKRFPNVQTFLSSNVSKAKSKGLALVVGMNVIKGSPSGGQMSASQVQSYGTALLSDSYPCAFINWTYRDTYMSSGSIRDAMKTLRSRAQNRSSKTCKAS